MIYVGSLTYSPVYKSHCCAFGRACEDIGLEVRYLFSKEYAWLLPQDIKDKTIFIGGSKGFLTIGMDTANPKNRLHIKREFEKNKPSHVYMHNYHPLNYYIADLCKELNGKFIYHAHEPLVENKRAHGGFQRYWLILNEYLERQLIKNTSIAIVSSNEGLRLFEKAYPWFKGDRLYIPLIYEDVTTNNVSSDREFITFVGPPVPAKGTDTFLHIVDYAFSNKLPLRFLLITRKKVDETFWSRKNLTVFYKEQITDEEYGELMKKSSVVLTPYKRETQSSVVLVSYMHGTPVVSSNIGGLPEFIKAGTTGFLVSENATIEEWVEKISLTINNFHNMSSFCRQYFVDNFSQENWKHYLNKLSIG